MDVTACIFLLGMINIVMVDRKSKSPFAVAGAGASAPPSGRYGAPDAVEEG
jgi:hypothetical protein